MENRQKQCQSGQSGSDEVRIFLADHAATCAFGQWLAARVEATGIRVIMLAGPVGSGKTTLSAALVTALPGGDDAEVSSPSFTLCNSYPTRPPVLHCDLYRDVDIPDELENALDSPGILVLVEWAEKLFVTDLPSCRLDILFKMGDSSRELVLRPHGDGAQELVASLMADLPPKCRLVQG